MHKSYLSTLITDFRNVFSECGTVARGAPCVLTDCVLLHSMLHLLPSHYPLLSTYMFYKKKNAIHHHVCVPFGLQFINIWAAIHKSGFRVISSEMQSKKYAPKGFAYQMFFPFHSLTLRNHRSMKCDYKQVGLFIFYLKRKPPFCYIISQ